MPPSNNEYISSSKGNTHKQTRHYKLSEKDCTLLSWLLAKQSVSSRIEGTPPSRYCTMMDNPTPRTASSRNKINNANSLRCKGSVLIGFLMSIVGFYGGIIVGTNMQGSGGGGGDTCWSADDPRLQRLVKDRVDKVVETRVKEQVDQVSAKYEQQQQRRQQQQQQEKKQVVGGGGGAQETPLLFPPNALGKFASGMSRVNRDQFASQFDMGVPLDKSSRGNQDVLILYGQDKALPTNPFDKASAKNTGEVPLIDSVDEAVENCDNLHVILTSFDRAKQCIAVMGQYEAFHIQKWMRLPASGPVTSKAPLKFVNRGAQDSGRKSSKPPTKAQTLAYWKVLKTYLTTLPDVLDSLKQVAQKVAKDNTIIVMVCNHGQSELLMNFACNAKSKGLDISQVLLFATDLETKALAEGLGITAFYDPHNFEAMPKKAARAYADANFMAMMAAKVYCVQMVSMLGYDVLFQDVDVVWFQNPLEWFHNTTKAQDFDIYFQDDGNHALFYAPYSANTGFYYVRHNDRTQYFFNSLLMAGDLILSTHSHQIALIALLNEHASMYNLRVKILERNTPEFPGGFTYHRKADYMKAMLAGRVTPYIFHMSWTFLNKANKALYFRQMGEWYLQDTCVGSTVPQITGVETVSGGGLLDSCCATWRPDLIRPSCFILQGD
jgi:hypothetical protein